VGVGNNQSIAIFLRTIRDVKFTCYTWLSLFQGEVTEMGGIWYEKSVPAHL